MSAMRVYYLFITNTKTCKDTTCFCNSLNDLRFIIISICKSTQLLRQIYKL